MGNSLVQMPHHDALTRAGTAFTSAHHMGSRIGAVCAPHDPRTPLTEDAALYSPDDIPLPPNFAPQSLFDNGALNTRDE